MAHRLLPLLLVALLFTRVYAQTVKLGDSVNLTVSGNCTDGEIKRVSGAKSELMATLVDNQWEPEENYKQRIEHLSTSAVRLNNVNINDQTFEFDCDKSVTTIQLTVVVPYELSVNEGETARLMCHEVTAGLSVTIKWEVNGRLVLQVNCSSELKVSEEFKGRVSVPSDRCTTGDMTLTVDQVQLKDQGVFVCYVEEGDGKKTRGYSGVRMKVRERNSDLITTSASPPTTEKPADKEHTRPRFIVGTILIVVLLAAVAALTFYLMCYYAVKSCRAAGKPADLTGGRDEQELVSLQRDNDH